MGNLRILLCPLWLYRHFAYWAICLLGYSASWATLPLGLLCFLGLPLGLLCLLDCFASWACLLDYFASWATLPLGLLCLLGYFASWAALPLGLHIDSLPLGPYLIDTVCFDNAGILICLLGCTITGHLLVCQLISYVNMPNWDTLWDRIW
jgi:hypothetical protein